VEQKVSHKSAQIPDNKENNCVAKAYPESGHRRKVGLPDPAVERRGQPHRHPPRTTHHRNHARDGQHPSSDEKLTIDLRGAVSPQMHSERLLPAARRTLKTVNQKQDHHRHQQMRHKGARSRTKERLSKRNTPSLERINHCRRQPPKEPAR
jgi:hypothetical protein